MSQHHLPLAGPDDLTFYRIRDDLTRLYNPVDSIETMYVEQISMCRERLMRAQSGERRYFQTIDIIEAIIEQNKVYTAITRYVADCQRAWKQAVGMLEKRQKERQRRRTDLSSPNARRPYDRAAMAATQSEPLPTSPKTQPAITTRE